MADGRGEDLTPFSRVNSALVLREEAGGSPESLSYRAQRTSDFRQLPGGGAGWGPGGPGGQFPAAFLLFVSSSIGRAILRIGLAVTLDHVCL